MTAKMVKICLDHMFRYSTGFIKFRWRSISELSDFLSSVASFRERHLVRQIPQSAPLTFGDAESGASLGVSTKLQCQGVSDFVKVGECILGVRHCGAVAFQ